MSRAPVLELKLDAAVAALLEGLGGMVARKEVALLVVLLITLLMTLLMELLVRLGAPLRGCCAATSATRMQH